MQKNCFSEMEALQKLFKSKFKQQALDGDSKYAKMNLEDSNPNNLPPPLKICALTIAQVKDFRVRKIILNVLLFRYNYEFKLNTFSVLLYYVSFLIPLPFNGF